jgi:hypothetical protein
MITWSCGESDRKEVVVRSIADCESAPSITACADDSILP